MGRRSYNWSDFDFDDREYEEEPSTAQLRKRLGREPAPVSGEGRKLATTFWGLAWCRNLECYQDYANRLPRGRTYLRQGHVLDLHIERGRITAVVMGSSVYTQQIDIDPVNNASWDAIRQRCRGQLGSLIDLLEGRMPDEVMNAVTEPREGLFPAPWEIRMSCSCPDWAEMCKHLAASLYGVGVRLDAEPDLLFILRGVSPEELVDAKAIVSDGAGQIPAGQLSEIFGVLIDDRVGGTAAKKKTAKQKTSAAKKTANKKTAAKKTVAVQETSAAKKTTNKKTAKKTTNKKTAAKKKTTNKKTAKKTTNKKTAAKKTAKKKTAAKTTANKKTATKKISNRRKWLNGTELRAHGLSPAKVRAWVRAGYLITVEGRDDYRLLPEAHRRLRDGDL